MNLMLPSKQIIALTLLNFIVVNVIGKIFLHLLPKRWKETAHITYGRILVAGLVSVFIGLLLTNYYVVSKGYIDRKNIFPAALVTIFLVR